MSIVINTLIVVATLVSLYILFHVVVGVFSLVGDLVDALFSRSFWKRVKRYF